MPWRPGWVSEGSEGPAELHLFVESWSKITGEIAFSSAEAAEDPGCSGEGGQVWLEMQDDPLVGQRRVCEASAGC